MVCFQLFNQNMTTILICYQLLVIFKKIYRTCLIKIIFFRRRVWIRVEALPDDAHSGLTSKKKDVLNSIRKAIEAKGLDSEYNFVPLVRGVLAL